MAAQCVSTPTQTLYQTLTTTSTSTSFSQLISTTPAVLTTFTSKSCLVPISLISTACLSFTDIQVVSTIQPAQTNTVQVPFVFQVPVPITVPTNTLFQPCSTSPSSPLSSVLTSVLVLTTPPPSTSVRSWSTMLSNGQQSVVYETVIVTHSPTSVYVPTTAFVSGNQIDGADTSSHLGIVVGASVGGACFVFIVVAMLLWLRRRRKRLDDAFEKTNGEDFRGEAVQRSKDRKRFDIDSDPIPQPYHYGLIGQEGSVSDDVGNPVSTPVGFSTATSVQNSTLSESISQSSSRRPSTSTNSLAPFLNSDQRTASLVPYIPPVPSEADNVRPSLPPHISMTFGNWSNEVTDSLDSPVSIHLPTGTLKVVNQLDN